MNIPVQGLLWEAPASFEQHLQSRRPLIEAAAAQNRTAELSTWTYLQDSEQQLIGLMNGNPPLENAMTV